VRVVVPPVEVVGLSELGHHLLGQRPWRTFRAFGVVLAEQHRRGRQRGLPAVDPDRMEERAQLPDLVAVTLPTGELGSQVREVALQQVSIDLGQLLDAGPVAEDREPGQRAKAAAHGLQDQAGAQPPAHPPLDQFP
jgi:hypothetical protein